MTTVEWQRQLVAALRESRGLRVSRLLDHRLVYKDGRGLFITESFTTAEQQLVSWKPKGVSGWMAAFIKSGVRVLLAFGNNQLDDAVTQAIEHLSLLLNALERNAPSSDWLLPELVRTCELLQETSVAADHLSNSTDHDEAVPDNGRQVEVFNALRINIGKNIRNTTMAGMCVATFPLLVAYCIKVCISLRNLKMAASMQRTIEQAEIDWAVVPKGCVAAFRAQLGILSLQQSNLTKANENLSWAIQHIGKRHADERRELIDKLIVVRMRLGILPTVELLREHDLEKVYGEIVQSIKSGDLNLFEREMNSHAVWFLERGTLLTLERLKLIVARVLIQRLWEGYCELLLNEEPQMKPGGPNTVQIPLDLFTGVFREQLKDPDLALQTEFTTEDMGCWLSLCISKRLIRGYVSWPHETLVLSKQEPFPRIAAALAKES